MTRWGTGAALWLIVAQLGAAGLCAAELPRVPAGFSIKRVTTPEQLQHPTMACFDDRGRLYVCESAGTNRPAAALVSDPLDMIVRLEDTDGDGVFDKRVVFADRMVFPQGVLWHDGAVYTCSSPYVWKLEDTNDDGICDKRTVLVKSFGFSGNAADIHGPFLGPDGRLWWCDGRHGHEVRLNDEGLPGGPDNVASIPGVPEPGLPNPVGTLLSKGKAARIFSCRLDGSDLQTYAGGGMDNPVEVDFMDSGEVVGSVNLFYGTPRGDVLVHWVPGGVYHKADQKDCIAEFPRTVGLLDEIVNYGHVAVSGLTRYRGPQFGKDYQSSFFVSLFNTHKVIRTAVERQGSTFKPAGQEDFLVSDDPDFHPTDVFEDADGSLLVIDTGGWFRIGCPASQIAKPQIGGAIYRITRDGAPKVQDPYGLKIRFEDLKIGELVDLTADSRPVVAGKAVNRLRTVLVQQQSVPANLPAEQQERLEQLIDRNFDDGALPLRSVTLNRLHEQLSSTDATVLRAAIENLSRRLAQKNSPVSAAVRTRMVGLAASSMARQPADRVLEHSFTWLLLKAGDVGLARSLLSSEAPRVQRAALVALDQLPEGHLTREETLALLRTSDNELQREVFDVVASRQGWATGAVELIGQWLGESELPEDRASIVRRFLASRASESSVQALVESTSAKKALRPDVQKVLLEVMSEANVKQFPKAWIPGLKSALETENGPQRLAINVVQRHKVSELVPVLNALADSETASVDLRIAALEALQSGNRSGLSAKRFGLLVSQLDPDVDLLQSAAAARVLADSALTEPQLQTLIGLLDQDHAVIAPTLVRAFEGQKGPAIGKQLLSKLTAEVDHIRIPAADLQRALKDFPKDVQDLAEPLLAAQGVDLARQAARLEGLTAATKGGNVASGKALFFSNKALCSRCHRVNGQGEMIGPDLSMVGAIRQHHELVEAVIAPSASFVRSYRPWIVVTSDGKTHTGIISSETATELTLQTADFAEIRISREDIEALKESDVSIMPAGLEERLTEKELADLFAYLMSLKERK